MKLMLKAGTFLLLCAAVFNEVNACTCLDYGVPTCALFSRADAVFVGKIERITSAMGDKEADVQLGGVGSIIAGRRFDLGPLHPRARVQRR
jgi:hypothetical protein